jgi:hypothetical protein
MASKGGHGTRWRVRSIVAAALVVTVLAGLFALWPAPVLGINGKVLQSSVGNSSLLGPDSCTPARRGAWTCSRWDNQFSSTVPYRVRVDGFGCWDATRVSRYAGEGGSPKQISGCIRILDFVF